MDNLDKKKRFSPIALIRGFANKYFSFIALILFSFLSSYFPSVVRYNQNSLFGIGKGEFNLLIFKPFSLYSLWGKWHLWFSLMIALMYLLKVISSSALNYYKRKFREGFLKDWLIKKNNRFNQDELLRISEIFSSFIFCFFSLLIEVFSSVKINTRRITDLSTWARSLSCLFVCLFVMKVFELSINFLSSRKYFEGELSFFKDFYDEIKDFSYSRSGSLFFVLFFFLNFDVNPSTPGKANMINILLLSWSISSVSREVINFWKSSSLFIVTYESLVSDQKSDNDENSDQGLRFVEDNEKDSDEIDLDDQV